MGNVTDDRAKDEKDRPGKPEVTITFNGLETEVEYQPQASMQSLLEHGLNAFSVHDNRHLMALWTNAGVELPVEGSIEDAGVQPGDVLVLRPSAVRGG
jgi:hypothetical protein